MKRFCILLIILINGFLFCDLRIDKLQKVNYLNFYLGECYSNVEQDINSENYFAPEVGLNLLQLSFPASISLINYYSLDFERVIMNKNNSIIANDISIISLSLGMITEKESILSYKEGNRFLYFAISGGKILDNEGISVGLQIISRYVRRSKINYESVYPKYFVYLDKFNNNTSQIRAGLALCYDMPKILEDRLRMGKGTIQTDLMYRNRKRFFFYSSILLAGAGYYMNSVGDDYVDKYASATTTNDADSFRQKYESSTLARNSFYIVAGTTLVLSIYNWILEINS
ncbi:MAG: hypothetical protein K9N07_10230 [Candidatus Cloacimonetes bacterium]|nr:hypothetical protein [Candidatus Cloacimonadota bacterium]